MNTNARITVAVRFLAMMHFDEIFTPNPRKQQRQFAMATSVWKLCLD